MRRSCGPKVQRVSVSELVVVIHGLWLNGAEAALLRHRLRDDHGLPAEQFQYGTFTAGFDDNAAALRDHLDTLDAGRVHLVGHSTGGLLALAALEQRPWDRPGRTVCLGSPLRGSIAARRLAELGELGAMALGLTGREGLIEPRLEEYRGGREVGVIAGTTGIGAGLILGGLPEPNDGTIAVVETRLPGIKDHLELPVTHMGMLISAEVARQTAFFLRHGLFDRRTTL